MGSALTSSTPVLVMVWVPPTSLLRSRDDKNIVKQAGAELSQDQVRLVIKVDVVEEAWS